MKFSALILLNLLVLAACTPPETVEGETSSGNIKADAPYMWSSSAFPRDLRYSDQFEPDEIANITAMSAAWETAIEDKKNFFNHSASTPEVSAANMNLDALGRDGVNGIYKIRHWPNSLPGSALAVTQIFGRRFNIGDADEYVRIEHADILVNEHLYDFRTDNSAAFGDFDLRTVVLHEMGHFLGLSHKSGNTVMVPSIGTSTTNRTPTNIDTADISSKYKITLSSSAGSQMVMGTTKEYAPKSGDTGKVVRILIELHADGECVHKENGAVIQRHSK